jgi:two-component system phosphate regulon sensor histidine kinase PhoR
VSHWISHTAKLLLGVAVIAFVGWMAGFPVMGLAIAGLIYLAWHVTNLFRLYRWVSSPEREVPQSYGLWADLFGGLNSMVKIERSQQEQYLAKISEFSSLVDALPEALLVVDRQGIVTWCNASAVELLNLKIPGDLGKSLTSLSRDPNISGWLADQSPVKKPVDLPSPRGDGGWLTISSVPFRENKQLVVLRNITGIHDVDQIRRDFVANISHELRTPLTVLRGYLELLEDHPSEEVSEPVKKMLGPAFQMQALLNDLLDLSRLQSEELRGKDELVDVPAMLEHLKERAEGLSRGNHRIEFEVNQQLFLAGVASDLESAFSNLITNAIKYTPKGGTIKVSWDQSRRGPQLQVRDTGIGIPGRDVPRVTERFYRVGSDRARETGGTGLGLAIVKHVLNAHQAQLIITSELGLGSEFTCVFPDYRTRAGNPGSGGTID